MADYTAQIAAIKEAMAQGARRIIFREGGTHREIEYPSFKEMQAALEWMEGQQSSKSRLRYVAL